MKKRRFAPHAQAARPGACYNPRHEQPIMIYRFGDAAFDTTARELRRAGQPVHLTTKAFDLLAILLAERPRVVRKQELYDRLWSDVIVVEGNLTVLVAEVRAALGDEARRVIRTVHRIGYAFAAEAMVEQERAAPEPGAPAHLLVWNDREFGLVPGENVVGRGPGVDVRIRSSTISRRHVVIRVEQSEAVLTDLESKNGTFVAGRRVTAPVALSDGVTVRIGSVDLRYRCPAAQSQTVTAAPSHPRATR